MTTATQTPVTVLTGYLGAGKTTLLNRILSEDHGRRYAVVVNEFGEVGIDADLIMKADEELFEMNNGCICCTVRGDLIRTVHGLLNKGGKFDAIIVETTGLADPGPVAQTFFVDGLLKTKTSLDSVTTVVDAKHVGQRLADSREAKEQIAFADQIVLNKTDLVSAAELRELEARLRRLNPLAPIHHAKRADVPLDAILGRGGFDLERIVTLEPDFLNPPHGDAGHVHDEHCDHDHHEHDHDEHGQRDHEHDDEIKSISLTSDKAMDRRKVSRWLTGLVAKQGKDILRAKGIIDVKNEKRRLVFQAVHMVLEGDLQREWKPEERRYSRIVFIGRKLDFAALKAGFDACVAA
jgi:G3E family GTPase